MRPRAARHRTMGQAPSEHPAAVLYEQFEAAPSAMRLTADGLVGRGGVLGARQLRSLAGSNRVSGFDGRVVGMSDLFGALCLGVAADLIMWHGVDGSTTVSPAARILEDRSTMLILAGAELTEPPDWNSPVVLRSPEWLADVVTEIRGLTALTFADFVGATR